MGGNFITTWEIELTDGHVEQHEDTLQIADLTQVDSASMAQDIHPNGEITFYWDLPAGVSGQNYQVRLRSSDGAKEYFSSRTVRDESQLRASFWNLRSLVRGETYQWHVRAWSDDHKTMRRSETKHFKYMQNPCHISLPGVMMLLMEDQE